MIGAGFAKDMLSQAESNHNALRGIGSHVYRHFDTACITDAIISRAVPVYPKASKAYLTSLRRQLIRDEKRLDGYRLMVLGFSVCTIAALAYWCFAWI